ncbi:MAG: carboxypeptidase regulatory-like domain-containing protein [Bryobacteraceae bacterium]
MRTTLSAAFAALALSGLMLAQETRSTLMGFVRDPQGAVIPNATVVITHVDTNTTVNLRTNDTGYYEAPLLMPGSYTVSFEAPGFKKLVRTGITLQVSDRREVSATLEVGGVTESVTVTGEPPIVDVSRTDAGRTLDDRSVRDLPANANTVFTIIRFTPGVNSGNPPTLLGPHSTIGGSSYDTGSGIGGNTWTIDGAVNDGSGRYTANLPSVDIVAETKVLTTTFEGSFGHALGLGVAVQTKSGTNEYHGAASNTYWNQRWQGSTFFAKQNYYQNIASLRAQGKFAEADAAASRPIQPAGHSNLWTLNLTGPVQIPKVFNGKDKVFFSFFYQGQKDKKPEEASTYNRVVPTVDNKKGDFSDLLRVAANPSQYQLYDPYSTRPDPARPGHYIRDAIPNNILPGQYIQMGKKFYDNYVKYWPDPNNWFDKTVAPTTNPYLSITAPYNWEFNQFSGRLDLNWWSKHRFFGRFTQNHFFEDRGDWTYDIIKGLNSGNTGGVTRDDQNGVIDWVYTVTPATVLHASISVSNWSTAAAQRETPYKFKPSDVGLPKYLDEKCGNWCYLPRMTVSGYTANGIAGTPTKTYSTFWGHNVDLAHIRGNHSLKGGIDFRRQIRSNHAGNNNGTYTFENTYFRRFDDSGGIGYSPANIGLSWASFMMGMPTSITISDNDSFIVGNPYYAWYIQDQWRVNRKLTLTLSLRTEYEVGATERFNRFIIDYDPSARLPISDAVEAAYAAKPQPEVPASQFKIDGGAIYAGTPGARKRAWDSSLMWLPRIGFGYELMPKTVLRGGYGIYYDTTNVNAMAYGPNQNYYSRSTNPILYTTDANKIPVFNPLYSANGAFPTVSPLNDPFPVRPDGTRFDKPLRNSLGAMATVGAGWTYPNYKYHARQQRWRIGIERQIGTHDVVEVSYEGSYASNLTTNIARHKGVPSTMYNFTQTRNDTVANYLSATVPNPFYGITTAGTVPSNANAIYPDSVKNNSTLWTWMATQSIFTSPNRSRSALLFGDPNGNVNVPEPRFYSRTHSIVVSYNHRFARGLSATVGYTWLLRKDARSYFQGWHPDDPTNPQVPYWQKATLAPHRLTGTFVYDLPFGEGRKWVHNRYLSLVVGGWTLAGTAQFQAGSHLTFGNIFFYGDPNSIKLEKWEISRYFNNAGCVASTPIAPGDTVAGSGACTSGFEKRSNFAPASYQYRFFPTYIEGLRAPGIYQVDGSVSREFKILERMRFVARMDVLNVANHGILNGPDLTPTSASFGRITSESNSPRRFIQIQGRLRW